MTPLDALRWIWRESNLQLNERAVMSALVLRSDADGRCWPSLTTLTRESGLARSTVADVLNKLEHQRLLQRDRRPIPASTIYTVLIPGPGSGLVRHADGPRDGLAVVRQADAGSPVPGHEVPNERAKLKGPNKGARSQANRAGRRGRSPSSAKPEHAEAARTLVAKLDALLKQQGLQGVTNWAIAQKIAGAAMNNGIPVDEALAALDWAFTDSYWRRQFVASGMKPLAHARAAWRERETPKARSAWRDPGAGGPQFDPNGPWGHLAKEAAT